MGFESRLSRVVGTSTALTAFAVAVVAGMTAGNAAGRTLLVAIVSMFICHILGSIVGSVAERVINEHLTAYRAANPVPESDLGKIASAAKVVAEAAKKTAA